MAEGLRGSIVFTTLKQPDLRSMVFRRKTGHANGAASGLLDVDWQK